MTLYEAVSNPDTPLVNQLVEWALEVFRRSGANIHMGLELPRVFSEAGLPAPVAHLGAPAGTGPDWVGYEYLQHSIASLLPLMEAFGIATAAEVDVATLGERLQREAESSGRLLVLPPHVTAYAKLPT